MLRAQHADGQKREETFHVQGSSQPFRALFRSASGRGDERRQLRLIAGRAIALLQVSVDVDGIGVVQDST